MLGRKNNITICFDFDLSLTTKHLHNECCTIIDLCNETGTAAEKQQLKDNQTDYLWHRLLPLESSGSAEGWRQLFSNLGKYNIAIVTKSQFPEVIEKFLKDIIKLDKDVIEKIYIESGNTEAKNKIGHINRVLAHFGQDPNVVRPFLGVILLDDTEEGFKEIEAEGGITIRLLPGDSKNLDIAKETLPAAIDKVGELEIDQERLTEFSNKLALASRIFFNSNLKSDESISPISRIQREADHQFFTFLDTVEHLEEEYERLYRDKDLQGTGKMPWDATIGIPETINKHPDKYHVIRMIALILNDIYIKYPEVKNKNEKLAQSIAYIQDVQGYKEIERGGEKRENRLVETSKIKATTPNQP